MRSVWQTIFGFSHLSASSRFLSKLSFDPFAPTHPSICYWHGGRKEILGHSHGDMQGIISSFDFCSTSIQVFHVLKISFYLSSLYSTSKAARNSVSVRAVTRFSENPISGWSPPNYQRAWHVLGSTGGPADPSIYTSCLVQRCFGSATLSVALLIDNGPAYIHVNGTDTPLQWVLGSCWR